MSETSYGIAPTIQPSFRVGDVFNRSFAVFGRNFWPITLVVAVPTAPFLLMGLSFVGLDVNTFDGKSLPLGWISVGVVALVAAIFLYPLAQAAVLQITFQAMRGVPVNINDAVATALSRAFALVGTTFYVGLLSMLGGLLLFVPGVIVLCAGAVAVQVCVVESVGPIASFSRSAVLTKGHRWQIFGILMVVSIVGGIANATIQGSATASLGQTMAVIIAFPVSTVIRAFSAVVGVVMYHDLRVAKEGLDTDRLAAVFE